VAGGGIQRWQSTLRASRSIKLAHGHYKGLRTASVSSVEPDEPPLQAERPAMRDAADHETSTITGPGCLVTRSAEAALVPALQLTLAKVTRCSVAAWLDSAA
jgi:hypothetical protein